MRDYRERLNLRAEVFATIYSEALQQLGKANKRGKQGRQGKVTGNWILNMEKQNMVPTDIERRRVIAQLLRIPPILFGLGQVEDVLYHRTTSTHVLTPSPAPPFLTYTSLDLEWH